MVDRLADFARHFRSSFPAAAGGRLLVALSGGADSVALLHLLCDPGLRLRLEVAHVHHGVRGVDADLDAELCARLADGLDLPFHLVRLAPDASPPEGREASWRRRRYEALLATAARRGIEVVATGHHRDDVAEGVLVQLLRGAGPRALAGIAPRTEAGVIRPLLPYRRSELRAWLEARGLSWREDRSNLDHEHPRNLVRGRLLPLLEHAAPALRDHLVALAEALAADEAALASDLARRTTFIDPWIPNGGVATASIASLPPALRTRWLHAQVERAGIGPATRRHLAALHALLGEDGPRAITLGGRWRLRRARGRLWLEPPRPPSPYALALAPGDEVALPFGGWFVRARRPGTPAAGPATWRADLAAGRLIVRTPGRDDVVTGSRGVEPLRRVLAAILPAHLRSSWPVLVTGDTIAWVPGVWQETADRPAESMVVEVTRR